MECPTSVVLKGTITNAVPDTYRELRVDKGRMYRGSRRRRRRRTDGGEQVAVMGALTALMLVGSSGRLCVECRFTVIRSSSWVVDVEIPRVVWGGKPSHRLMGHDLAHQVVKRLNYINGLMTGDFRERESLGRYAQIPL